jgi:hypothetical protein
MTSVIGRFCCKSRKLHRSEFVLISWNATRPTIRTPSVALSRSPVNLACGDEVPQIHTRKTRLWPLEFGQLLQNDFCNKIGTFEKLLRPGEVGYQEQSRHPKSSNPITLLTLTSFG